MGFHFKWLVVGLMGCVSIVVAEEALVSPSSTPPVVQHGGREGDREAPPVSLEPEPFQNASAPFLEALIPNGERSKALIQSVVQLHGQTEPSPASLQQFVESLPEEALFLAQESGGVMLGLERPELDKPLRDLAQRRFQELEAGQKKAPEPASPEVAAAKAPVSKPKSPPSPKPLERPVPTTAMPSGDWQQRFLQRRDQALHLMSQKKDPKEVEPLFRAMAHDYAAAFHLDREEKKTRDAASYDVKTEDVLSKIRDIETQGEFYSRGGSRYEKLFLDTFRKEMAKYGQSFTSEEIANDLLSHPEGWMGDQTGKVPFLVDAEKLSSSWRFAHATVALDGVIAGLRVKLANGEPVSESDKALFQSAFSDWSKDPQVALRHLQKDPKAASRLRAEMNQMHVWGKLISAGLLDDMNSDPTLAAWVGDQLKAAGGSSRLRQAFQDSLYRDLVPAKTDATLGSGLGGSLFHTSLVFSALAELDPKRRRELTQHFSELLTKHGATEKLIPYYPHHDLPVDETVLSSTGRSVTVATAKYLSDPTPENADIALNSLERLSRNFGFYHESVGKNGTHRFDRMAPYYLAPALRSAGKMVSALSAQSENLTKDQRDKLEIVRNDLMLSTLSTFEPTHHSMTRPGSDYREIGGAFTTALGLEFLADSAPRRSVRVPRRQIASE